MNGRVIDGSSSLAYAALAGRIAIALLFISSAVAHSILWNAAVQEAVDGQVPFPVFSLILGLVVEFVGGLMILFGFHARLGAILLIGFTIVATAYFKDFWSASPPQPARIQEFLTNVGLIGGLLILYASGPGRLSFDGRQ